MLMRRRSRVARDKQNEDVVNVCYYLFISFVLLAALCNRLVR